MSGTDLVPIVESTVSLGVITATTPAQLVARATDAADALASVIKAKRLFSSIQGKQYVRCEGWTTLAAMMGCLPREVSNVESEGRYVATVELVRMTDGAILTRASAECGPDEPTWKSRSLYARRSMAATRATSKACRLAFSWVMALAGYEATPAEEIPHEERTIQEATPTAGRTNTWKAPTAKDLSEPPAALAAPDPEAWSPPTTVDKGPRFPAKVVTWPFKKEIGTLKIGVAIDASTPATDLTGALDFIAEYVRGSQYTKMVEKSGVKAARAVEEIREHIEVVLDAKRDPESAA